MDMIWTMKVHVSVSNTYPFFYKLLKNVENIAERECDNHGTQNVEEDGTCICKARFLGNLCNECIRGYSGTTCEDCNLGYHRNEETCIGKNYGDLYLFRVTSFVKTVSKSKHLCYYKSLI